MKVMILLKGINLGVSYCDVPFNRFDGRVLFGMGYTKVRDLLENDTYSIRKHWREK